MRPLSYAQPRQHPRLACPPPPSLQFSSSCVLDIYTPKGISRIFAIMTQRGSALGTQCTLLCTLPFRECVCVCVYVTVCDCVCLHECTGWACLPVQSCMCIALWCVVWLVCICMRCLATGGGLREGWCVIGTNHNICHMLNNTRARGKLTAQYTYLTFTIFLYSISQYDM